MPIDIDQGSIQDPSIDPGTPAPDRSDAGVSSDVFNQLFGGGTGESLPGISAGEDSLSLFPDARPMKVEIPGAEVPPASPAVPPAQTAPLSELDLLKRERELLAKELETRKTYDPLLQVIREDPEAYKFLEQRIAGKDAPKAPAVPVAPERPASYNEVEAYQNPESPSWKYRTEMDRYRDQKAEFLENQLRTQAQTLEAERQQQIAAQQREQQLGMVRQQLTSAYGLQPQDAEEFIRVMSDPNSVTMENLVELFKLRKSRSSPPTPAGRTSMVQPLPPGGNAPAPPRGPADPNEAFNASLVGWDERLKQRYDKRK